MKETVGKIASDLLIKKPDTLSPIEQMRESLSDYDKNMYECIDRSIKDFSGDFYIVVITKKEPLMPNVLRNYFIGRKSCPTPNYDEAVYRYTKATDDIKLLWVVPSRDTCNLLLDNKHAVPLEEFQLLEFVLKFADGTLFREAKMLNGESVDSILLA